MAFLRRRACRCAARQYGDGRRISIGARAHELTQTFSTPAVAAAATHDPDPLAGAVLRSLGRSFKNRFSLSPTWAAFVGWFTFGVLPVWRLMAQFDEYIAFEKQQLTYAGEWLQTRGGSEPAAFHDRARMLRFRGGLRGAALFCVVAAFSLIALDLF